MPAHRGGLSFCPFSGKGLRGDSTPARKTKKRQNTPTTANKKKYINLMKNNKMKKIYKILKQRKRAQKSATA